jgi:hypothetical protein
MYNGQTGKKGEGSEMKRTAAKADLPEGFTGAKRAQNA